MPIERPAFNTDGTFVCRIPFKFRGVHFAKGDEFPWQDPDVDCEPRRLESLYRSRYIDPANPGDFEESYAYDPATCKIENRGKGLWFVVEEGYEDVQITPKAAQRLKKVKGSTEIKPEEIVEPEE